jgi:acyl-coenzyme A thioesterase PaaI-like protein
MANTKTLPHDLSNPYLQKFIKQATNPILQRLFFLSKLPAAGFMGARVQDLTPDAATVSLPYGWRSKNPFRSTYFAAQAAAAELSTGLLLSAHIQGRGKIAMLITQMEADFIQTATGRTLFVCNQSQEIIQAVQETITTGESRRISLVSKGVQPQADGSNVEVSNFRFEWSIKAK